jgi:hypothetical protein
MTEMISVQQLLAALPWLVEMDISTYVRLAGPLKNGFWWQFPSWSSPCGIGWTRAVRTHWVADDGRAAVEWRSLDLSASTGTVGRHQRAIRTRL